ncbi:hypothetical protein [Methylomonas fluvii]|nr:hypothetical protein [Methylomonas fluvii]
MLNILLRSGIVDHVSLRILECLERHDITSNLLFNPNFRYLVGGSEWMPRERPDTSCFRKYIGVRGKGDFTLITPTPGAIG